LGSCETVAATPPMSVASIGQADAVASPSSVAGNDVAPSSTFHGFMRLPRELRLVIWDMAIRYPSYIKPNGRLARYFQKNIEVDDYAEIGDHPVMPKLLPAICYASKTTREETVAVVIEGSTFEVRTIKDAVFL
jgi:hypothetical protein